MPIYVPKLSDVEAELSRRKLRMSEFCPRLGFEPAAHHKLLCDALDKVLSEGNQHIMFFFPPGSAKSTYSSQLFPAYAVAKKPGTLVMQVSHTLDLAESFGRKARNFMAQDEYKETFPGVSINADKTAAGEWEVSNGSTYKAGGVGTGLSGRRADIGIIDDPVKDMQAVMSETQRESLWQWYLSVFRTRIKPGGSELLIMTRWHEDDLAGRLLAAEPGKWKVIRVPMVCEDEDDPLGREMGERLWPEYFTQEMVQTAKLDPRIWDSLYQQRPTAKEGSLFKVDRIKMVLPHEVPGDQPAYMAHDLAATEGGGDWSAVAVIRRPKDKNEVFIDIRRCQKEPSERNKWLLKIARAIKPASYRIPKDPGQAGKEQAERMQREMVAEGVNNCVISAISGDKEVRAEGLAAAVNAGMVRIVQSRDSKDFLEELRQFPHGKHDDMVDAAADAYNEMMLSGNSQTEVKSRK